MKIDILWHSFILHSCYFSRKSIDSSRIWLRSLSNKADEITRSAIDSKISTTINNWWSLCTLFIYYYLRTLFDFSWISIRNIKIAIGKIIPSKSFNSTLEYSLLLAYMISKVLAVTLLINKLVDLYLSNFDNFQLSINLQEVILFVPCCVTTAFYTRYLIIVRLFSHDHTLVCGGTAKRHPVSYNRVQKTAVSALFEDR
jgi:hypothetical protein